MAAKLSSSNSSDLPRVLFALKASHRNKNPQSQSPLSPVLLKLGSSNRLLRGYYLRLALLNLIKIMPNNTERFATLVRLSPLLYLGQALLKRMSWYDAY